MKANVGVPKKTHSASRAGLTASALASIFNAPCKLETHQIGAGAIIHDRKLCLEIRQPFLPIFFCAYRIHFSLCDALSHVGETVACWKSGGRPDPADVGAKSEAEGKRDLEVSAIKNILESFATAALGLELKDRIRELSLLPQCLSASDTSDRSPTAWAAWHTDRGVVTLRALYDEVQSQRVKAHVVKIAWWIGAVHHDSW
jgi:hypothetical protein